MNDKFQAINKTKSCSLWLCRLIIIILKSIVYQNVERKKILWHTFNQDFLNFEYASQVLDLVCLNYSRPERERNKEEEEEEDISKDGQKQVNNKLTPQAIKNMSNDVKKGRENKNWLPSVLNDQINKS